MNYPLISEYVQSIKFSEENFDKLSNLCPVLDEDGNPIMFSGNFAIVFKMQDKQTGKLHAVKCFLREQEGREENYKLIASELEYVSSTFLTPIQYLEKEIFVDTTQGEDTEFPVLQMDWVEGLTLDKYIRNNIHDPYKLALITYQFCRMGSWLLSQEFAHGDLKPDNIIVREDGQLVLVDYDGMFVPAMRGQKARELGSVDYRHPLRREDVFNGSIDDFSIASIALSLKALSLAPELLNDFGAEDRLLFSAKDYQNIGESECVKAIQSLSNDTELSQLLGLFYIAYARNNLSDVSFRLINIRKPEYIPDVVFSISITEEDLENAIEDEYGVQYSRDGLKLLKSPKNIEYYKIKEGTRIICDSAFYCCDKLTFIDIIDSIDYIGCSAFESCKSLKGICIKNENIIIKQYAFSYCDELETVIIPHIKRISEGMFSHCKKLMTVTANTVFYIEKNAFSDCVSLSFTVPQTVRKIEPGAFIGIKQLSCFNEYFIWHLNSLYTSDMRLLIYYNGDPFKYIVPIGVESICKEVFHSCPNFIKLPKTITSDCLESIQNFDSDVIQIPNDRNEYISYGIPLITNEDIFIDNFGVIYNSYKTKLLRFPLRLSLHSYTILESCTIIDKNAFVYDIDCDGDGCTFFIGNKLYELNLPNGLKEIRENAFSGCLFKKLNIPSSVVKIERNALEYSPVRRLTINGIIDNIKLDIFGSKQKLNCIIEIPSFLQDFYSSLNDYTIYFNVEESVLLTQINGYKIDKGVKYSYDYKILMDGINCEDTVYNVNSKCIMIYENAFKHCKSVKEIKMPDGLAYINDYAFSYSSIEQVDIPNSVMKLGKGVFQYCLRLNYVKLPSEIEKIENVSFSNCKNLKEIILPSNLVVLGVAAFSGCETIRKINIPQHVEIIEEDAFRWCKSLEEINAPDNWSLLLSSKSFADCPNLNKVILPWYHCKIEQDVFIGCVSLKNIIKRNSQMLDLKDASLKNIVKFESECDLPF